MVQPWAVVSVPLAVGAAADVVVVVVTAAIEKVRLDEKTQMKQLDNLRPETQYCKPIWIFEPRQ